MTIAAFAQRAVNTKPMSPTINCERRMSRLRARATRARETAALARATTFHLRATAARTGSVLTRVSDIDVQNTAPDDPRSTKKTSKKLLTPSAFQPTCSLVAKPMTCRYSSAFAL